MDFLMDPQPKSQARPQIPGADVPADPQISLHSVELFCVFPLEIRSNNEHALDFKSGNYGP